MVKKIKKGFTKNATLIIKPEEIISGAFIFAFKVLQEVYYDGCWLKLSSITKILPWLKDECRFYTYKDCCYHIPISSDELRLAINSFLFEPEEHRKLFIS